MTYELKIAVKSRVFSYSRQRLLKPGVTFSYLAPGAGKPLDAILTGAVIADLRVRGPLAAAPLQRKAADVVGQAEDSSAAHSHPTLSRALRRMHSVYTSCLSLISH